MPVHRIEYIFQNAETLAALLDCPSKNIIRCLELANGIPHDHHGSCLIIGTWEPSWIKRHVKSKGFNGIPKEDMKKSFCRVVTAFEPKCEKYLNETVVHSLTMTV